MLTSICLWKLVAVRCLSREIENQVASANKDEPEWKRREERFFQVCNYLFCQSYQSCIERKKKPPLCLQYFKRECTLWHNGSKESNDSRFSKIVKLLGFTASYNDRLFPSLILELYPDGTLRDFIMRITGLGEKERVLLVAIPLSKSMLETKSFVRIATRCCFRTFILYALISWRIITEFMQSDNSA